MTRAESFQAQGLQTSPQLAPPPSPGPLPAGSLCRALGHYGNRSGTRRTATLPRSAGRLEGVGRLRWWEGGVGVGGGWERWA